MPTMYQMTTNHELRLRNDHNIASSILLAVPANVTVSGNLYTAPADLYGNGARYQMAGDKWLQITYNGATGWVAYVHLGMIYARDFRELEQYLAPAELPAEFTLTDVNGKTKRYVRMDE